MSEIQHQKTRPIRALFHGSCRGSGEGSRAASDVAGVIIGGGAIIDAATATAAIICSSAMLWVFGCAVTTAAAAIGCGTVGGHGEGQGQGLRKGVGARRQGQEGHRANAHVFGTAAPG